MRESQHEHMYSITCPLAHGPWPLRTYGDTEPRDDYSKRAPTAREHLQQESTYSRRAPTAKQGKQQGGAKGEGPSLEVLQSKGTHEAKECQDRRSTL